MAETFDCLANLGRGVDDVGRVRLYVAEDVSLIRPHALEGLDSRRARVVVDILPCLPERLVPL